MTEQPIAEKDRTEVERLCRKLEAWIRHGEAVPADAKDYSRDIVHTELRWLIDEARTRVTSPEGKEG